MVHIADYYINFNTIENNIELEVLFHDIKTKKYLAIVDFSPQTDMAFLTIFLKMLSLKTKKIFNIDNF